jgi:uncharacterized membrane protein
MRMGRLTRAGLLIFVVGGLTVAVSLVTLVTASILNGGMNSAPLWASNFCGVAVAIMLSGFVLAGCGAVLDFVKEGR